MVKLVNGHSSARYVLEPLTSATRGMTPRGVVGYLANLPHHHGEEFGAPKDAEEPV